MENNYVRTTKIDKFNALIKFLETGESTNIPAKLDKDGNISKQGVTLDKIALAEFCKAEIALLERKSTTGEKKPTENQKNNLKLADCILEYLANNPVTEDYPGATCAEMAKNIPEFEPYTVSKVSSILRSANMEGKTTYQVVKGKKYFSLA